MSYPIRFQAQWADKTYLTQEMQEPEDEDEWDEEGKKDLEEESEEDDNDENEEEGSDKKEHVQAADKATEQKENAKVSVECPESPPSKEDPTKQQQAKEVAKPQAKAEVQATRETVAESPKGDESSVKCALVAFSFEFKLANTFWCTRSKLHHCHFNTVQVFWFVYRSCPWSCLIIFFNFHCKVTLTCRPSELKSWRNWKSLPAAKFTCLSDYGLCFQEGWHLLCGLNLLIGVPMS